MGGGSLSKKGEFMSFLAQILSQWLHYRCNNLSVFLTFRFELIQLYMSQNKRD